MLLITLSATEFPSETHHILGRYVAESEETDIPTNDLSFEQLKAIINRFEAVIAEAFVYETSEESKSSVLEQLQVIKAALSGK